MNTGVYLTLLFLGLNILHLPLHAEEPTVRRTLTNRTDRGTLSDHRESIRGDSGKWNDAPKVQLVPSIQTKPADLSFDDWADTLLGTKVSLSEDKDTWMILRTQQLDDNDRVWVEQIERDGNEIRIQLRQAIWQGNYRKNFTYYELLAVNLGKLKSADYILKWTIQPFTFRQFEDPGQPKGNWPKDEIPAPTSAESFTTPFSIRSAD